jgi:hypothetical protein
MRTVVPKVRLRPQGVGDLLFRSRRDGLIEFEFRD